MGINDTGLGAILKVSKLRRLRLIDNNAIIYKNEQRKRHKSS